MAFALDGLTGEPDRSEISNILFRAQAVQTRITGRLPQTADDAGASPDTSFHLTEHR